MVRREFEKRLGLTWKSLGLQKGSSETVVLFAFSPLLIMKISGHERTKDFYKYIRISPEEAANKIKELWIKRDGMRIVQDDGKVVYNKDLINQ